MSNASEVMVPLKSRALGELAPDKKWRYNESTDVLTWLDSGPAPSDLEINAKVAQIQQADDETQYYRKRGAAYEELSEQLDKLYHDINGGKFGDDAKTGAWYLSVKAVKDANPKS